MSQTTVFQMGSKGEVIRLASDEASPIASENEECDWESRIKHLENLSAVRESPVQKWSPYLDDDLEPHNMSSDMRPGATTLRSGLDPSPYDSMSSESEHAQHRWKRPLWIVLSSLILGPFSFFFLVAPWIYAALGYEVWKAVLSSWWAWTASPIIFAYCTRHWKTPVEDKRLDH